MAQAAPGPESIKIAKRKQYDNIVAALPSEVSDELYDGRSKQELQECEDNEERLCKTRIDNLTVEQLKKIAFTAARAVTPKQQKGLNMLLHSYKIEYVLIEASKEWMYSLSFNELCERIAAARLSVDAMNNPEGI